MDYLRYRMALQAVDKAYAVFGSNGAALLTKGEVYTGVSVKILRLSGDLRRARFVKAVSEGHKKFRAIAIASSGGQAWPCGICRRLCMSLLIRSTLLRGRMKIPDVRDIKNTEGFRL